MDDSGRINLKQKKNYHCSRGWLILSLIFSLFFMLCLGVPWLVYRDNRNSYNLSECLVLNVTVFRSDVYSPTCDSQCNYKDIYWFVSYYNSEAQLEIYDNIIETWISPNLIYGKEKLRRPDLKYPCYYQNSTLQLRWNLPYSNYKAIGITFLVFCGVFYVSISGIIFICYLNR